MAAPEDILPGALAHEAACPICLHDHLWLDCERCVCVAHIRNGID
jgi:hypothetical protein